MAKLTLWLREEARTTERRTPLLPDGAKELVNAGIEIIVEKSKKRIFADALYQEAGCKLVDAGTWEQAPDDAVILGLKELPPTPLSLKHTHIYFGHAYKEQSGWCELLGRFRRGGGSLLDIEYMTDANGKRVVAFGYWAGYMGAALALLQWQDRKADRSYLISEGLTPFVCAKTLDDLIDSRAPEGEKPTALVIGAGGRSGKGAAEILERHGAKVTRWGRKETANLNRDAILNHDILINCSFVDDMIPPFLTHDDVKMGKPLSVISDVSCDPFSDFNPLPLYDGPTSWTRPAISIHGGLDLIAIDNLPSLLPTEASMEFAGLLLPFLKSLPNRANDPVWTNCEDAYKQACHSMNTSEVA
jgi:saccharopine dehydrogenase (NAD+, L-lysine-forming)